MTFLDLGLDRQILRRIADIGYTNPTPIQEKAIPLVLMNRDILACAQTGTGKTASFTLPMIEILAAGQAKARMPRSLILEPTRELAAQVGESFDRYGKYHSLSKALLIGGENMNEQVKLLERGADVLIATPGRFLDVFNRGHLLMADVRILVIDEADRMLDMGFIPDVEKIVATLPPIRTTLLFSATMPNEIKLLSKQFLHNPKEINVTPPATTAATITQHLVMAQTNVLEPKTVQKIKRDTLRKLIEQQAVKNALVFCNRKRDVDIVFRSLQKHGYSAASLHGDMLQNIRIKTLKDFKENKIRFLVCSDVAARGLDVKGVSHVFNFDVPVNADDYTHRIGRTGRAGAKGHSFTIATRHDRKYIDAIEKNIAMKIPIFETPFSGCNSRNKSSIKSTRVSSQKENCAGQTKVNKIEGKQTQNKKNQDSLEKEPVVGLGQHVPAFLMKDMK